jgi:integrase
MRAVGRRRTKDKHLPQRVYIRNGVYFYASPAGPWKRLGTQYSEALKALADFVGNAPIGTLAHLIERYKREEFAGKAAKTRKGREQEFKPVAECFGHMMPEQIEPHHVWTFWKARGCTEQARHEVRALSVLLTFARRVGARKSPNPCFGLQLPGAKPRTHYVTDEAFLVVRDLAQPMIGHAMDLAYIAGMDEGTIRKLERKNLKEDGIEFERGKTGAFQLIEWNDELRLIVAAILRERPQLRRALICNRKGQAYSANGFQSQWQRLMRKAKEAGLAEHFHFHDLRAKSASDANDDQSAADRLGHADVKLTRRVYRRLPRRATALRILDARSISEPKPK